jgi:hypothetical protein
MPAHRLSILTLWVCALALAGCAADEAAPPPMLPDLSGLAWVGADDFLAVHDAKAVGEESLPRVSLLTAPRGTTPLLWTALDVDWTAAGGPSHDLEGIARVPGTALYLLAESGDGGSEYRRIFVAELTAAALTIREAAPWPVPVFDVEGTAVARVGGALYFLFAERAHGEGSTRIRWAPLALGPLRLGAFREAVIAPPWPLRWAPTAASTSLPPTTPTATTAPSAAPCGWSAASCRTTVGPRSCPPSHPSASPRSTA